MSKSKTGARFHFNGHGAGDLSEADRQVLDSMRFLDDVEEDRNYRTNSRLLTEALRDMSDVAQVSRSGR